MNDSRHTRKERQKIEKKKEKERENEIREVKKTIGQAIEEKYKKTLNNLEESIGTTSEEEKLKNKQEEKEAMNSKNLFITAITLFFLLVGVTFTCILLTELGILPKLMVM